MIVYEYRDAVARIGAPVLAPSPSRQYQFRSVYGYPEDVAAGINAAGNTQGLKGCMVYSDLVLIDVDNNEDVDSVVSIIESLNIQHEVFTTGNRGIHIHIPTIPVTGVNVIYSQQEWLKSIGVWGMIDTSIYREGGQFRCPGAVHSKTGKPKKLVREVHGDLLEITQLVPPPVVTETFVAEKGDPTEYFLNLLQRRTTGARHMHMFILWKRGREAGFNEDEVWDSILRWNDTMTDVPHTPSMMEKKRKGFK